MQNHEHSPHIGHHQHDHNQLNISEKREDHQHHKTKHGQHDHSNHHRMMIADFKKRFWLSLILTIPVLILSPLIQSFLGLDLNFTGSMWILWGLSSSIYVYGGWPFLTGFFSEIKKKSPGMMTLIALAITVAYVYSSSVVFGLSGKLFFWELATLIDIMLLGHWIEMSSILGASRALERLSQLIPDVAHLLDKGSIQDVHSSQLKEHDMILIKPGEKIPADGTIQKGQSYINESMLTGESKPIQKRVGSSVIAGSINGDGSLEVSVKNIGNDTYLSKVITLVKEAQTAKSKTQHLADKAAVWLTGISITAGTATFGGWLLAGQSLAFAVERMATVMVITCPHALGLAIPLVVAVSTSISAKNGLLIRNRTAFENARKISAIVFDKTGTLTEGNFGVASVEIIDQAYSEKQIVQLAASLEQNSEHPIARGIIAKARELHQDLLEVKNFKAIKGKGIEGSINNKGIKVVSPGYISEKYSSIATVSQTTQAITTVYLLEEEKVIGSMSLMDRIRSESKDAIQSLQHKGIKCWMLTGDNKNSAEFVSRELGLDGFYADVLPHEKQEKIKELQTQGQVVAMTGDGVNDAPALAQADVGIAIGSGTDVAAETADIILVNSNPQDVVALIDFGRSTYTKMIQNLIWATGYNVVAIPLAAGVLYNYGLVISPAIGAVFMSLSTVIVAINASFLKVRKA